MEVALPQKERRSLLSFLRRKKESEDRREDIRTRLSALVDNEDRALLNALFQRMKSFEEGVDAERFRIAFKDQHKKIDALIPTFIEEGRDRKTYRPALLALLLIDDERARTVADLIDRALRYLAAAYEREPGRKVTLGEISEKLDVPEGRAGEALAYFVEGPVSMSRTTGYPKGAEWYVIPDQEMLDLPDLDAVLARMTMYAEQRKNTVHRSKFVGGVLRSRGAKSWLRTHKKTAGAIVGGTVIGLGVLANLATVIEFFDRLITGE